MMQPSDFRTRARTVREAARQQLLKLRAERVSHKTLRLASRAEVVETAQEPVIGEVSPPLPEEAVAIIPDAAPFDVAAEPEIAPQQVAEEVAAPEIASEPVAEPIAEPKPKVAKRKAAPRLIISKPAPVEAPEDHSIRRAALAEMSDEAPVVSPVSLVAAPPKPPGLEEPVQVADPVCEFPLDQILDAPEPLPDPKVEPVADHTPAVAPQVAGAADDLSQLPGAGPGLIWMLHQCGIASLADLAAADPNGLSHKLGLVGQILDVSVWRNFALAQVQPLSQAS